MDMIRGLWQLPTADLFSAVWPAFLLRLLVEGEWKLAEYYRKYTKQGGAQELRDMHVPTVTMIRDKLMHFAAWWLGVLGGGHPVYLHGDGVLESGLSVMQRKMEEAGWKKAVLLDEALDLTQVVYTDTFNTNMTGSRTRH